MSEGNSAEEEKRLDWIEEEEREVEKYLDEDEEYTIWEQRLWEVYSSLVIKELQHTDQQVTTPTGMCFAVAQHAVREFQRLWNEGHPQ